MSGDGTRFDPASLADPSEELAGRVLTLQEIDGKLQPAWAEPTGDGGSQPITREQFGTGASTTVADNANDPLPWGVKSSGDDLLDISDPLAPTVITAGVYAVACTFARSGAAMTADGTWQASLELDEQNEDAAILGDGTDKMLRVGLSLTYYLPAGATIRAGILNRDGAAARDWRLENQIVQRLS